MLNILLEVQDRHETPAPSDIERDPLKNLEYVQAQRDEFQRHILELAPSVLSAEQVRYLSEQYQYLSCERADALERQQEAVARGEDIPLGWYPAWHER